MSKREKMRMGSLMVKWVFILVINSFIIMELLVVIEGYGDNSIIHHHDHHHTVYHGDGGGGDHIMRKMQALKASLLQRPPSLLVSPAPAYTPPPGTTTNARVYHVSNYGADPTGKADSTEALLKVFSEAANGASNGVLMAGISNLGGVEINLDGGDYLISRPLQFPKTSLGNILCLDEISSRGPRSMFIAREIKEREKTMKTSVLRISNP